MHTNLFARNGKLHKFATTNSNFKNQFIQTWIIVKRTCISIFSKIGVVDQLKPCTQNLFAKICKLHKLATCNWNFEKSRLSDMHYPLTDIHAHLEINRLVRYRNTTKRNYFHRRTDGRHDGQTDGQTSRTTTIGSFFEKRKNLLKMNTHTCIIVTTCNLFDHYHDPRKKQEECK